MSREVRALADDGAGDQLWNREVNYVKGWAEADMAAHDFMDVVVQAGVRADEVHFAASTTEEGEGVVRGGTSAAALREITRLIRLGAGLPDPEEEHWSF